jgi:hypothetical protein
MNTTPTAEAEPWVDRVETLDPADFRERYQARRRPVVLSNAFGQWPALGRFTPKFFLDHYADRPVRIRGRHYKLGEVIAMQQASSSEHPAPYPCTFAECDGLIADVSPRFPCSLPNRHTSALMPKSVFDLVNHLEIFFGGPGGEFPYLHYDMLRMHAWITQVYGDKEFTLYERGQEHLLYVHPEMPWMSRVDDLHDTERWPLLSQARRHKVVLRAGDALFIPCGTWHTARCLSMNITVAFDQLESTNWREFVRDVVTEERRKGHGLRARALSVYLGALGPVLDIAERFGANRRGDWGVAPLH